MRTVVFDAAHAPCQLDAQQTAAFQLVRRDLQPVPVVQRMNSVKTLLQMQREYGNRYVQRAIARARQSTTEARPALQIETAIERARGGGRALAGGKGSGEVGDAPYFTTGGVHFNDHFNNAANWRIDERA